MARFLSSSVAPHFYDGSRRRRRCTESLKMRKPARSRWTDAPGRIGFMSTQRRENRWQRLNCAARAGVMELSGSAPDTRHARAIASGGTAPLMSIIWLAWAWFHSNRVVGHKLSAIGSLYRKARSARHTLRLAAPGWGRQAPGTCHTGYAQVIPSAHPPHPRPHASPSILAAGPSRQTPLGGKVRWQRKFVSPARRMRHGLQF